MQPFLAVRPAAAAAGGDHYSGSRISPGRNTSATHSAQIFPASPSSPTQESVMALGSYLSSRGAGSGNDAAADQAADPARVPSSEGRPNGGASILTQHARRIDHVLFRAGWLLPENRQEALSALQAFCREIGGIVDASATPAWKRAALSNWRSEMARLFAGEARRSTSQTLLEPISALDLPCAAFLAILDGAVSEIGPDIRAPREAQLDLHFQHGTVAVTDLALRIAGMPAPAAPRLAQELGRALALTDILLGLADDAANHQLYLPRELLHAHDIFATIPSVVLAHPALPAVCGDLALRAEQHYAAANALIVHSSGAAAASAGSRFAALTLHTERGILRNLVARGWLRLGEPVRLSAKYQAMLMLRFLLFDR
jgi:phytoene synthase